MATDYYQILGVERNASQDDIKRAFRRLAHEHHPDKQGGNVDKFKEINCAIKRQKLAHPTYAATYSTSP